MITAETVTIYGR